METDSALKQVEGRLMLVTDKVTTLGAKLEEFVFRAQRIASAKKKNQKSNDTMFTYDLQSFRREIRTLSLDLESMPAAVNSIERSAKYSESSVKIASAVWRCCDRLNKSLQILADRSLLAHHHIRESDAKMEAWYVAQEIGQLAEKGKPLPTAANKIVIIVSTPPAGAAEPPR